MNTLYSITAAGLLSIALAAAPAMSMAGDSDGKSGHQLINHQRIEELKERAHWKHPGGMVKTLEAQMTDLQNQVTSLTASNTSLVSQLQAAVTQVNTLQGQVGLLQGRVSALESNSGGGADLAFLTKYLTLDPNPINGLPGPHLIFTGANVHIRSGAGFTDHTQALNSGSFVGLGNLVVGYNEVPKLPLTAIRTGAHNIVGGVGHSFSSFGGLVLGRQNTIGGKFATVLGGSQNEADGDSSSILGGRTLITNGFAEHNP